MNSETITPDKWEDLQEATQKIFTILEEYEFTFQEGLATLCVLLERGAERRIEWGEEVDVVCDRLTEAHGVMIEHIRTCNETRVND